MTNKVKRFVTNVLVIIVLLMSGTVFAQSQGGGQKGGQHGPPPIPNSEQIEKRVNDMSKEISLTSEQEKQVLDLYIAHFEKVKEKREANAQHRKEMEALKLEFENNVKALLNEEQQKQFVSFQEKNRPKHGGKRK